MTANGNGENVHRFVSASTSCSVRARHTNTHTWHTMLIYRFRYVRIICVHCRVELKSWRVAGSKCDDWREMRKFFWYYFCCRTMKMRLNPYACTRSPSSSSEFPSDKEEGQQREEKPFFILFHFMSVHKITAYVCRRIHRLRWQRRRRQRQ